MSEDLVTAEEFEKGQAILPDNITLDWSKDSNGNRRYSVNGEDVYVAKYKNYVIAAAVAIEETLSYEEKRICGDS